VRGVFWFRNDLRLRDNRGLAALAARVDELALVFVLDERLLASPRTGAPRARFLLDCLTRLGADLAVRGCPLQVRCGDPREELPKLLAETGAGWLAWNRDGSPYARARDAAVRAAAERAGVRVLEYKDRVIFESEEVRTVDGRPYAVYTPYRNAWRARFEREPELPERAPRLPAPVPGLGSAPIPPATEVGFPTAAAELPTGGEAAAWRRLERFLEHGVRAYPERRDRPGLDGTSRLSPYLRFGAISPRVCVAAALERAREERACAPGVRKWLDELVWREFYAAILSEHPRVLRHSYRPEFDGLRWEQDPSGFAAWCEGRTGFPIVDAGMRQLAATGWMHNRVRMLAASFLTKDLLVDWRSGEAFFFLQLVDGDPASNNGGWQWAASTGTDAQPWFRIFNPTAQGERFDPDGAYVRRWVPELEGLPDDLVHRPWEAPMLAPRYPRPIVDHAERRVLALRRYGEARRGAGGAA
jgi:deoxyribodipyrimidine photo-lyase